MSNNKKQQQKNSKKKKGQGSTISLSDFQSQVVQKQQEQQQQYDDSFDLEDIDIEQQRLIFEQIKASEEEQQQNSIINAAATNSTSEVEASTTQNVAADDEEPSLLTDEQLARILQDEENSKIAVVIGGGSSTASLFNSGTYNEDAIIRSYMRNRTRREGEEYNSDEDDYDDENYDDDDEDYDEAEHIRGSDLTLDEESAMESSYDVQYISNANSTGYGGDRMDALMRADTKVFQGQLRDHSAQHFSSRRNKKETTQRIRSVDKQDQSTTDKVMDHRTSMILYKLMNSGIISRLDGCVSSGKESHIYHAVGCLDEVTGETMGAEVDFCIKIFKIVGVSFRRREEYQNSEHRFKDKMKTNSQKNVKKYAEKEMRNLKKLQQAGVSCPTPYLLRDHVILMSFIGKQGFPAPSLKDVNTSLDKLQSIYSQIIVNMRKMYQKAHLIHSDLSEYNILYLHGQVYFIDVSQSVESHHINAKAFLRNDCQHVNEFFIKQGLTSILTHKELFEYIINTEQSYMTEEELLETVMSVTFDRDVSTFDQRLDESYFSQVCLPQSTVCYDDDETVDTNSLVHKMENVVASTQVVD